MIKHNDSSNELKVFLVGRDMIESCNIASVLTALRQLAATPALVRENYSSVEFVFDGYNDTPTELWQIPAVRKWVQTLHAHFKYWFHFCEKGAGPGLMVIMMCLMPMGEVSPGEVEGESKTTIAPGSLSNLMLELFTSANGLHHVHGLSQEENSLMTAHVKDFLQATFG